MKRKLHFLLAVCIGLTASVGWLQAETVIADNAADLLAKVAAAKDGDTIKLKAEVYLLDQQLVINKGIVLEGITGSPDFTMIKANRDAEWPKKSDGSGEIDNSKTNLISIEGGTAGKSVKLKDLVVFNSMASGVNAQSAMTTYFEKVSIEGSNNAGLLVHSAVEVKSLLTRGNGWGSVNVDKGAPNYTPNFKFVDSNFQANEPYKIWTELTTADNVVTLPENSNWKTYTIQGSGTEKTKKYWVQSDLDMDYVAQFPRNNNLKAGYTFVYAGGTSINIQQSSNDGFITINDNGKILLELPEKCNPVIFGGSKEALNGNTSITMESGRVFALIGGGYNANVKDVALTVNGGTIKQFLVGGGFGPNDSKESAKSADATAVTMNVKGATVGYLISGGMEFSKVTSTQVKLDGATITHALGGGFAPVGFLQSLSQTFNNSLNSIGSTEFAMTGGVVKSEIMLGGGFSFSYAKKVTAILSGVTFNGGLYGIGFNGFSDEVTATVNGCTFNKVNPDYNTIAAMVRGKAGNVSMTFDENCKFDSQYECYLGADRDNEYNPAPMTDNATFVFKGSSTPIVKVSEGMQNVTLTGAKVNVAPFLRQLSSSTMVKDFTIPTGKTWTFNDGLAMASGVTLTKTGTLKYDKSFEADVSTANELKAAVALGADVINLADATYTLDNEALTLTKGVVLQGSDKSKCKVTGQLIIAPTDSVDITLKELSFEQAAGTAGAGEMIAINGKVKLDIQDCILTNNRAGTGTSAINCVFNVANSVSGGSAIFNNTIINLNGSYQRAFVVNASKYANLEWYGSTIQGSAEGRSQQGLRIQNVINPVVFDHSTINLAGKASANYPIYLASGDISLSITNQSKVSGWCAIYAAGWNSKEEPFKNIYVNVDNSLLSGVAAESGGSNDFGLIVLEKTWNSKVHLTNSRLISNAENTTDVPLYAVVFQHGQYDNSSKLLEAKNNLVCFERCTLQSTSEITPNLISYYNTQYDKLSPDNKVMVDNDTKLLDMDGQDLIKVVGSNDTLRNAVVSVPVALMYVYEKKNIPVAYPGDFIIAPAIKANAAISALNAKDAISTGYTVPDSITIVCKDAYLVTGEKAAKAFADRVSDKAVFYLKQSSDNSAPMFSTVAVGNNRVKVSTSTAWNDAANANRSVEIAANATLTVNVAMPLDTVFMAEGAQLIANANVTAKAVQLTYGVKKTWKAFGFPYEIGKIVGLNGSTEVTTVASSADKGIWTASIKNAEPVFEVSSNNATPAASCIIAAHKDSTILVTSTTTGNALISLSSQPEPNAPVVTKADEVVNFKIVSNPNIYDIQLTQTAYVLSADGKTFDRVDNPTIKAFQSFVLADESTTSTLRSLRVDDTPTGNEIVPTDGYYVRTGKGTITIHTAEPVQVIVVDMLGRIYYNARVTDGAQIAVPAGIYAVNRQKVIVK